MQAFSQLSNSCLHAVEGLVDHFMMLISSAARCKVMASLTVVTMRENSFRKPIYASRLVSSPMILVRLRRRVRFAYLRYENVQWFSMETVSKIS